MSQLKNRNFPDVLRYFWQTLVALSLLSYLVCIYCKYILHLGYPYDWPLFYRADKYRDFTRYAERFRYFHHIKFFTLPGLPFVYPAPGALIYELYYGFTPHPLRFFLGTIVLASCLFAIFFMHALSKSGISRITAALFTGTVLLLSYPFAFLFERANIEIFVWVLLVIGAWTYCKSRTYIAASCFGLAAALKIFPFVYLALLLRKGQYRPLIYGVVIAMVATLTSFWLVGPTVSDAASGLVRGLHAQEDGFVLHMHPLSSPQIIGYDHSLFTWLKLAEVHHDLHRTLSIYMLTVACIGLLLFFLRIRHLPIINQVLALTVAAILFPPFSGDYTLIHMYIPWAMLTLYAVSLDPHDIRSPGLGIAFGCFALIFTPLSFINYHTQQLPEAFRIAGPFRALVMLLLFVVALRYPFGEYSGYPDSLSSGARQETDLVAHAQSPPQLP
jgi:hypothetical protein